MQFVDNIDYNMCARTYVVTGHEIEYFVFLGPLKFYELSLTVFSWRLLCCTFYVLYIFLKADSLSTPAHIIHFSKIKNYFLWSAIDELNWSDYRYWISQAINPSLTLFSLWIINHTEFQSHQNSHCRAETWPWWKGETWTFRVIV